MKEIILLRLDSTYEMVVSWLREDLEEFVEELKKSRPLPELLDKFIWIDRGNSEIYIVLYTNNNSYTAIITHSCPNGCAYPEGECADCFWYVNCNALSRKPRPGEWWRRGRSLIDGPISRELWTKMLFRILSYEVLEPRISVEETVTKKRRPWQRT
jgi:hypothetical protein